MYHDILIILHPSQLVIVFLVSSLKVTNSTEEMRNPYRPALPVLSTVSVLQKTCFRSGSFFHSCVLLSCRERETCLRRATHASSVGSGIFIQSHALGTEFYGRISLGNVSASIAFAGRACEVGKFHSALRSICSAVLVSVLVCAAYCIRRWGTLRSHIEYEQFLCTWF